MQIDHPNHETLNTFYEAFSKKDHATMRTFYKPESTFRDPVFTLSDGKQAADMWEMLCTRGKDMTMEYEILDVTDTGGKVRWEARYTFSTTGRMVHNIVESTLVLKDGKIIQHVDVFDFWRWTRQALGVPGALLGWSGFMKNKVQTTAMDGFKQFVAKKEA
jgi:hypothetical protein